MATYLELANYKGDNGSDYDNLRAKIKVALAVKAQAIAASTSPTAAEVTWAKDVLKELDSVAEETVNYVLAANKSATIAQINAASDTTVQTNVDEAVDNLYGV
jgi:hypothetical protein